MKKKLVLFLIFFNVLSASAQLISGRVVDDNNEPVPYASVYVKELSLGTVCNEAGYFEVRTGEGRFTLLFQCMGYENITRFEDVTTDKPLTTIVVLKPKTYELNVVEVKSGNEDPAYRIMRNVIRKAPQNASMVKSFKANVYIRGTLHIKKISSMVKWMARDDLKENKIREGDTYLEESVNEIDYTAPVKVRQTVKSFHSTFPGNDEGKSSGAIGFISGNIYGSGAFGNAISPLSSQAFGYYRFQYQGVITYDSTTVYKIKVIPRGSGPQYVSGMLYVIDGLWCLYSLDIHISEQLGIDIFIYQNFGEVQNSAWLPVSNQYRVEMDLMGNAGNFLYTTSIRYLVLKVSPPDTGPKPVSYKSANKNLRTVTANKIGKLHQRESKLLRKDNISNKEAAKLADVRRKQNELIIRDSLRMNHEYIENYKTVFDSNARLKDTVQWNLIRPIPLTPVERSGLRLRDTIRQTVKSSDSLAGRQSRKTTGKILNSLIFGGMVAFDSLNTFRTGGFLNPLVLSFSTVDGFLYKTTFEYAVRKFDRYNFKFYMNPGFAFSRKVLLGETGLTLALNGKLKPDLKLSFESTSRDYNSNGAVSLENTLSSLFFRQNLCRLYESQSFNFRLNMHLTHELEFSSAFQYATNKPLNNNSSFSFFYRDSREYSENIPLNEHYLMVEHNDLNLSFGFTYKPMPYYVLKNGVKSPRAGMNQTPVISLFYKKAIRTHSLSSHYNLLSATIGQQVRINRHSRFQYTVSGGGYISKGSLFFDDFLHLNIQPLAIGVKDLYGTLQFGTYYQYSTNKYFAEANTEYTAARLLLKRLPVLRNRLWEEHIYTGFWYSPDHGSLAEFGYGIGNQAYSFGTFTAFDKHGNMGVNVRVSLQLFGKKEVTIGF